LRVLVDEDPAFTQVRNITDNAARRRAEHHNAFLSFGENIAPGRSTVPDDGLPWQSTRQPVVLDAITPGLGPADAAFTTVMVWESYPAAHCYGVRYGLKSDSFAPYLDLPGWVTTPLEVALGAPAGTRALLSRKGWQVRDARVPTRDPWTYLEYIRRSKAELSVAKQGYVVSRCGWFSERSVAYLASGRPVLVQETGFSDWLASGRGVVPFSTPQDALAGIEEIERDYAQHCRSAREIAEEYFDSRTVLPALLEAVTTSETRTRDLTPNRRSP
jgi:hypothetical protein